MRAFLLAAFVIWCVATLATADGGLLSLELELYPTGAVIQTAMHLQNRGPRALLLDPCSNPLFLTLQSRPGHFASGQRVASSISSNRLYFAKRSDCRIDPFLN
jgi:hypothetical protein